MRGEERDVYDVYTVSNTVCSEPGRYVYEIDWLVSGRYLPYGGVSTVWVPVTWQVGTYHVKESSPHTFKDRLYKLVWFSVLVLVSVCGRPGRSRNGPANK